MLIMKCRARNIVAQRKLYLFFSLHRSYTGTASFAGTKVTLAGEQIKTSAAEMASADMALQHAQRPMPGHQQLPEVSDHIGNTNELCLINSDPHSIDRLVAICRMEGVGHVVLVSRQR